jgi:pantoate--beta-alanine ligase
MVIARMIELTGYPLKLKIVPTVRENSGLAMSSRNMRLSATEKETAAEIYQTLEILKKNLKKGALNELKQQAVDYLTNKGFEVDYVELTDDRLRELNEWDGDLSVVALIAASLNNIRLIDNMTIH